MQSQKTNGAIAQLVEQRTENPCVPGSIPGGTTLKSTEYQSVGFFYAQVFPSFLSIFFDVVAWGAADWQLFHQIVLTPLYTGYSKW